MELVAVGASGQEGIQRFRECRPDVTLMDLRLGDMSGIDAMMAIRRDFPQARVVMLTTFGGDVEIERALEAGACSYLLKSVAPRELAEVIRSVHAGKKAIPAGVAACLAEHVGDEPLTPREIEVLQHIAAGSRNRGIAKKLFISEDTVKVHVRHLLEKLRASGRAQALAIGLRRGVIAL